mmetsp:Transcript_26320/g.26570  ORF Transcript_26320/g.26570 Transcript_26320/m.26570 type:complete len:192 (+) Transcript_26320:49-624(+)
MQHCQKGRELLLDLQRSDWLPQYNEEGVRIVITEMTNAWNNIMEIMNNSQVEEIPDSVKVLLVYHHQCLSRNRRYLNAFLQHRLSRVRQLRWETGAVLPENLRPNLSDRENEYFAAYSGVLSEYCERIGDIDITTYLEPPKELMIEIRVLVDCGEIMTDTGPVTLDPGTTHLLRRSEVEPLIRQGLVMHIV